MKQKMISWISRSQVWGFFLSMAIMVVIALAYFAPDNFDGASLNQSDMLQGTANGHEGAEYLAQTGEKALWTGSLFSGMPTFQISPTYASNALFDWLNGLYGLWLPSPSNLLYMMMFGFFIMLYCMGLRWYYALIGAIGWGFSSYFIIIIGAGHIWKFLALSYIPPTIGGLVLCYRGRYLLGSALTAVFAMLQLNANHPQMTYYFAFVIAGFVIVYLIDALRSKKIKQWATATALLAGAGALALGANLPSLYNTYEYSKETKRAQSELASADAPQSPSAEKPTGGLPKSQIVGWSYGRSEMFSLLVPNVKGGATIKAENGQPAMKTLAQLDGASSESPMNQQLLGYFTQYFNDSEGTNGPVYVGALICALFLLGCLIVRGPMKWCLVVLTVLSMLLALGINFESLTDLMIYHFPMYNKFRAVESILVVAEFTMPLLAVLALATLLKPNTDKAGTDTRVKALLFSFGICAAVCLIGVIAPGAFGSVFTSQDNEVFAQIQQQNIPVFDLQQAIERLRLGMVRSDSLRSLIFIALGFAALLAAVKGKLGRGAAIAAVGALVLVDLYVVDKRYVDHSNFLAANPYESIDISAGLAPDGLDKKIMEDTATSYRVLDIPDFGGARRSYHHKMVGGYHAAKLNRYEDLIQRRMRHVLGLGYIPSFRNDSIVKTYTPEEQKVIAEALADYRVLDMLNTKYIITGDAEVPVLENTSALGNAWLVDELRYVDDANAEMDALSTLDPARQAVADKKFMSALGNDVVAPQPGDTIYLTSYTPNRLTYHVSTRSGGLGVFSEVYFPWGWKATIDGQPAELGRVNYVLRAMRLPAGSHTVTMTFDPDSIHTTTNVAYACVTLIYLLLAAGIFSAFVSPRKKKGSVKDTK